MTVRKQAKLTAEGEAGGVDHLYESSSRIALNEPGAPTRSLIRGWTRISAEAGKSRVQLWRDIRAGLFPAPIELGPNSIAWFTDEIEAWKAARRRRTYIAEPADTGQAA
jgi:predicted DNA-binding transcriptional regulator AlpA